MNRHLNFRNVLCALTLVSSACDAESSVDLSALEVSEEAAILDEIRNATEEQIAAEWEPHDPIFEKLTIDDEAPLPTDEATLDDLAAELDPTAALAPSCVKFLEYRAGGYDRTWVYNTCSYGVRVKAIIAWGPDSSCRYLAARTPTYYYNFSHDYHISGKTDRIDRC